MLRTIIHPLRTIPVLGPRLLSINEWVRRKRFGSSAYWERRYRDGGTSGGGSYGALALFKAEVLNRFVAEHSVESVVEFGCGDGNQLSLANYPKYLGLDVSPTAVTLCRQRFATDPHKRFALLSDGVDARADLALSLDVIFHLVEDAVFESYMRALFDSAVRFVVIYSDNVERPSPSPHVRHRRFSGWIEQHAPEWQLATHIPNRYPGDGMEGTSFAEFWIYTHGG